MTLGTADVRISELLPFWVNGTLAADEAAAVAAAVAANPAFAAEARFLQSLRERVQADDAGYSPGEMGLARLKRSIAAAPVAAAPVYRMISLRAAAASVMLAALVGFGANAVLRPAPVEYVQASGGEGGAAFVVGFNGLATAAAISEYLSAQGMVILDGPSAVGLYRLAPLDDAGTDLAAMAQELQSRTDLFDMVDLAE